jgi:thioredoxin 2
MSEVQIVRCDNCVALNRLPADKLVQGLAPVCAKCKYPLTNIAPVSITDATFHTVEGSCVPVLLDVWAPWCGPCQHISPIVDELAKELAGRVFVAKLNADENPVTAWRLRIQGIPALLVFHGGDEVDRIVGVQPKSEILRRLTPMLA